MTESIYRNPQLHPQNHPPYPQDNGLRFSLSHFPSYIFGPFFIVIAKVKHMRGHSCCNVHGQTPKRRSLIPYIKPRLAIYCRATRKRHLFIFFLLYFIIISFRCVTWKLFLNWFVTKALNRNVKKLETALCLQNFIEIELKNFLITAFLLYIFTQFLFNSTKWI